jgi:hypothetical protein
MQEEAMARFGPQRHVKKRLIVIPITSEFEVKAGSFEKRQRENVRGY